MNLTAPRTIFDLVVFLFFAGFTVLAFTYNPEARQLPLLFGAAGIVLALPQLIFDAFPGSRRHFGFIDKSAAFQQEQLDRTRERVAGQERMEPSVDQESEWRRVGQAILWIFIFVVLLALLNYLIAVPLFLLLMIRFAGRESWTSAILVAAGVGAVIWVVFDLLLQVRL